MKPNTERLLFSVFWGLGGARVKSQCEPQRAGFLEARGKAFLRVGRHRTLRTGIGWEGVQEKESFGRWRE